MPALSLNEIKEKTDNFSLKSLVGEGSHARVYRAVLNSGEEVVIKKYDKPSNPESNTEFLKQVTCSTFYISVAINSERVESSVWLLVYLLYSPFKS